MTLYAYKTPDGEILQETMHSDEQEGIRLLWLYIAAKDFEAKDPSANLCVGEYQRVEVSAVEVQGLEQGSEG